MSYNEVGSSNERVRPAAEASDLWTLFIRRAHPSLTSLEPAYCADCGNEVPGVFLTPGNHAFVFCADWGTSECANPYKK